ncbi:MAG: glycoside hydrolase family 15 protein [Actinomycetota bacterium]|nr:glycoside hydrolase family 15 protein [Actinomycetota bacterium]
MPLPLEDYALVGDLQSAAVVGRDGSIDWLCLPRFDSGACFAALLGTADHGRWLLAPAGGQSAARRRYRPGTLILETQFETADGAVRVVDCMPPRTGQPELVRLVEGVSGCVRMTTEMVVRFDYGRVVPWVSRRDGRLSAVAGPDALWLDAEVALHGEDMRTRGEFSVREAESVAFVLAWHPSHLAGPPPGDARALVADTERWWRDWSQRCSYDGPWREEVVSSLVALKALIHQPTGGIVAAPTTSLPEQIGGVRNWDYRFCWLRDATFTLLALIEGGYLDEARAWRDWLLRAVAGDPADMQIMYGVAGERRLPELELDWLPGYEGSRPVRTGNAASRQFQLDVYGEVMDALHQARAHGLEPDPQAWELQRALLGFLDDAWREPDEGIWEVRGGTRHFVHSKVMAWVAFDRGVQAVERFGLHGPVERWRGQREAIRDEVLRHGYDAERHTFVRAYGSKELDAALLMIPLVGFLPAEDPRVHSTVEAIERELLVDGLVLRYRTDVAQDGLPPGEGAFLPCTFWLVDCLALIGRHDDAVALFERLLGLANDVGLLSEEYDAAAGRLVGNFPQAFTHIGLVNSARNLATTIGPAEKRCAGADQTKLG